MKKLSLFFLPLIFMIIDSCTPDSLASGGAGVISAPVPPSNLSVTVISSTQANLTWRDNSSNEDGFIIERKMLSNSYVIIATPTANSTTYSDAGLISHTDYTYRMTSYNSAGNSGIYTTEVMITTP
jgi:hypothetical protein